MSSSIVRNKIKAFIASEFPTENTMDLTALYGELEEELKSRGIGRRDNWLGIQFIPTSDTHRTVGNSNGSCYRESGSVFLHIVAPVQTGVADLILTRAEAIKAGFRDKRIDGDLVVEDVTPPNFESSGTLEFEGGYTACSIIVSYYRDYNI